MFWDVEVYLAKTSDDFQLVRVLALQDFDDLVRVAVSEELPVLCCVLDFLSIANDLFVGSQLSFFCKINNLGDV